MREVELQRYTTAMPTSKPGHTSSWTSDCYKDAKTVLLDTKLNWLLCFIPFAFISANAAWHDAATFILCGIPLVSLAERLSFATDELSSYVSGTMAGLLNATFGNAPELILCGFALHRGLVRVTQLSLLGSVLGNLLLVTGTAFVIGGIKNKNMNFNKEICMMNMTLLWFGTLCILIPSMLLDTNTVSGGAARLLGMSRFMAIIMVLIYGGYMAFQMFTHKELYEEADEADGNNSDATCHRAERTALLASDEDDRNTSARTRRVSGTNTEQQDPEVQLSSAETEHNDEDDDDGPSISKVTAIVVMAVVALFIAILSDYLVGSITGAALEMKVPLPFLVVILIPMINNASEHSVAIIFAIKNKLEVTMGIVMGSSTQILVLILPFACVLAWMMGQPMDLNLGTFESWVLLSTVILVFFISHDGLANWLRGMVLLCAYLVFCAAFWCHTDPLLHTQDVGGA